MGSGPEYERVELPLVKQLCGMGWEHIECAHSSRPNDTGRESFNDVLLLDRVRAALRRINIDDDGNQWLDDGRINQAISRLTRPQAKSLLEINEELVETLLRGVIVDGWDGGRARTIHFVDWIAADPLDRNDFLVVNQFRVDPPGSRTPIYLDAVLFVNGIPLVVIEAKSPTKPDPIGDAIDQLRRYANQRESVEPEGSERLFHTNQFVVATCFEEAKVGTFTSLAEHYTEWKTTAPVREKDVEAEIGAARLSPQQRLVAGMLRPDRLLDLVRHFTLFMQPEERKIKVVARYQQYRAVCATIDRLVTGRTRAQDGEHDRRGGIIWHTQGSGKSLTMVFLVRAMRSHPALVGFKVVVVTDRKDLQKQLASTAELTGETVLTATRVAKAKELLRTSGKALIFVMIQKYRDPEAKKTDDAALKNIGELDPSPEVLVLVDEAHRSHGSTLHAALRKALPNAARVGFTGTPIIMGDKPKTHTIFGNYLDRYDIRQSETDGATVPIVYEGRTTRGGVTDADDIDEFIDLYGLTPEQTEQLKQRYATKRNVAEAEQLIAAKAKNMLRHYVGAVLPNGFKAQVVATSRRAAVRYRTALQAARDALVGDLDALDPVWKSSDALERIDRLPAKRAELVRAWPYRDVIAQLDFVPVISAAQNDETDIAPWTSGHEQVVEDFKTRKLPMAGVPAEQANPVAMLIVNAMLLTGFDAPREQVLYLDKAIREADLLQAIARVNRTAPGKRNGYVVDYYGVSHHLAEALEAYAADDIKGALTSLNDEVPRLAAAHEAVRQLFAPLRDVGTVTVQDACVEALADERLRVRFETALKAFTRSMEIVLPSETALPYVADAKAFGTIAHLARRRYRDHTLFDVRVYGEKVRALIDAHVQALGIEQKIPPISITAADYADKVSRLTSPRAKASEMEHAIRHHISERMDSDPAHYARLSEHLEHVLSELKDQWEQLALALADFLPVVTAGRTEATDGLDPLTEAPFHDLLIQALTENSREVTPERAGPLRQVTIDIVHLIREDVRLVGFWDNAHKREQLRRAVIHRLDDTRMEDGSDLFDYAWLRPLADRLLELAKHNHHRLASSS
ncbi:type I restriction endonuclease subunit R [Micromonospora sp. M61]|uniref:type I restriction endonuclease subunit R n=1 Tax=Micromonospora sp. M61 TaxID=2824890 RepID=UPI001B3877C0|nr:HsdR family type I site-specific deoxyribonuclease [Micromonospora sp. M61]MBQ0977862.1 type I restriction endonuclease subunit R [Micromonospora sp. M61]